MQAMVLAAGYGTRLWPLTADRAKPAVPFLGRPLVAHLVEHLVASGVERIVVNTHHHPGSVRGALAAYDVLYSHEDVILGTAGALAKARDEGLLDPGAPVLIANGKLYTDVDVAALLETHARTGAAVTMGLRDNPAREHFREVLVDSDRVVGFGPGRVPEGPAPLLFTGLHVVSPEVLAAMRAEPSDTVADVYPPFIEAGAVVACRLDAGRWWEMSTLSRYHALHRRAHAEGLGPDVVFSEGASVARGAVVRGSVLWEGAAVAPGAIVEDCVLGAGVRVIAGERWSRVVLVRRSVVLGDPEAERRGRTDGDRLVVPLGPT